MPQVYIAAIIAVFIIIILWGGLLFQLSGRRWRFFWFMLPTLPLSAIVNLAVKAPIVRLVSQTFAITTDRLQNTSIFFLIFLLFLAPVTEELIKVFPLIIPGIRRWIQHDAIWVGYALGLGFGIGEACYLAYGIAQNPAFDQYAWYLFTGYIGERMIVSFMHAFMTIVFVRELQKGGGHFWSGWLFAILWHVVVNSTAFLYQLGLIPIWIPNISLIIILLIMVFFFEKYRKQWLSREYSNDIQAEVVYFRRKD